MVTEGALLADLGQTLRTVKGQETMEQGYSFKLTKLMVAAGTG